RHADAPLMRFDQRRQPPPQGRRLIGGQRRLGERKQEASGGDGQFGPALDFRRPNHRHSFVRFPTQYKARSDRSSNCPSQGAGEARKISSPETSSLLRATTFISGPGSSTTVVPSSDRK